MGVYVDLYKIKYDELINELMKIEEIDDKDMLEKILLAFGEKIGDYYILLCNEYYEEYNSYYGLTDFIDTYFNLPNDYSKKGSHDVILDLNEEINCNQNKYDVVGKLDLELDWDEE